MPKKNLSQNKIGLLATIAIYIYIYIYGKYGTRREAEMANIARDKAECYISIEAECQVLYCTYSTWQGNDLSVKKNFLNIHLPPLNIPPVC